MDLSWGDADPGRCAECNTPHEWVRPGKTQPTCLCDLKNARIFDLEMTLRHVRASLEECCCPAPVADPKELCSAMIGCVKEALGETN